MARQIFLAFSLNLGQTAEDRSETGPTGPMAGSME
jgi:hypothetical protein